MLSTDSLLAVARAWAAVRQARASLPSGGDGPVSELDLLQPELCLTDIEPEPGFLVRCLPQPHGSTLSLVTQAVSFLDSVGAPDQSQDVLVARRYLTALLRRL